eukprot:CAMPEP_0202867966 /NCGR_PEP_ID=MMETSP1391-20130828/9876_1 /ASSEMBLY_ACC=CAM_ASM_000867 /TAXON_ID=1034604 /ORGANISM="Chlamydomonas leiostraca, Strain SAG 11-49" /LENGTH=157 /DNA_ID=CAMNT_0049548059 /DNA_START=873 /DNA_END=1343 /DNA_ORIENTATION=-
MQREAGTGGCGSVLLRTVHCPGCSADRLTSSTPRCFFTRHSQAPAPVTASVHHWLQPARRLPSVARHKRALRVQAKARGCRVVQDGVHRGLDGADLLERRAHTAQQLALRAEEQDVRQARDLVRLDPRKHALVLGVGLEEGEGARQLGVLGNLAEGW